MLYLPVSNKTQVISKINKASNVNVPRQFSANNLNTPNVAFGRKPRRYSNFGNGAQYPNLMKMQGPNTVGYQQNMNLYAGAGANTINWTTGKTYRPSTKLNKVAKNKYNPTGWVSNAKTLRNASGPKSNNKARSYTYNGTRKFGERDYSDLVYTRDNMQQGAKNIISTYTSLYE